MVRRLILAIAIPVLFITSPQQGTLAAGTKPSKTLEIDGNVRLAGVTGNCTCNDQWYALGLRKGKLDVSATLNTFKGQLTTAYSIQVWLMRKGEPLASKAVSCFTNQTKCGRTVGFVYKVTRRGKYYLLVRGEGANTIDYDIQVIGKIYRLGCSFTC